MTTHQLARMLDQLRHGLGDLLKPATANTFAEVSTTFLQEPEIKLKELLSNHDARKSAPGAKKKKLDPRQVIEIIRRIRNGESVEKPANLDQLTIPQIREVLSAFQQKAPGKKPDALRALDQLMTAPPGSGTEVDEQLGKALDLVKIDRAMELYTLLETDRSLSLTEVRERIQPIYKLNLPEAEEFSRRIGYTPFGSRKEILERIQTNLEGIKMSQQRADRIMAGQSG